MDSISQRTRTPMQKVKELYSIFAWTPGTLTNITQHIDSIYGLTNNVGLWQQLSESVNKPLHHAGDYHAPA